MSVETRERTVAPCVSCTTLPTAESQSGWLVVAVRTLEHRMLIANALEGVGLGPIHHSSGIVACQVRAWQLEGFAAELSAVLPSEILDENRASVSWEHTMTGGDGDTGPDEPSLAALLQSMERGWLIDILRANRIETHIQPIVDAANGYRTMGHECLTRGRTATGEIITAPRLFSAAERSALVFHLDRSARLASIRNVARHDPAGRYFINFTPTAIYNPAYCLQSTVGAIEEGGIEPRQITFEVIESIRMRDLDHLSRIFGFYRQRGFTVALDDVVGGSSSTEMITALVPDYVKIDRSLVGGVERDAGNQRTITDLLALCRSLGVEVIAEGIERPEERDWLAASGIDLMQGFLFGHPVAI